MGGGQPMTKEQEEIKLLKDFTKMDFSNPMGWTGYYDTELKELSQAVETALNVLKEKDEQIAKYKKIYKEYDCYRWVKELDKKDKIIDLMATTLSAICTGLSTVRVQFEKEYCEFMNCDEDCCWKTDTSCKDCIKQYFERISKE